MRPSCALPAAALLGLLIFEVVEAPRSYVVSGETVYQWQDGRVTLLGCLFVVFLLSFLASVGRPRLLKLAAGASVAATAMTFALFVSFNYGTNGPDGLLPGLFSTSSAMAILGVLDAMRLSPVYGLAVQTLAWFLAMVVSFFFLRFGKGTRMAFVESIIVASLALAAYGLGVYLVIPQWSARSVTGLQDGTPISWLTNNDLALLASLVCLGFVTVRLGLTRRYVRDEEG